MNRLWVARLALIVMLLALGGGAATAQQECDVRGVVELPTEEAVITTGTVVISGWAADVAAPSGTGVSAVRIALDGDPDQDGVPVAAAYGLDRPDIAALFDGARFQPSGFGLMWDTTGVVPGRHTLYIQARSACGWTGSTRTVLVAGRGTTSPGTPTLTPTLSPSSPSPAPTARP